ncbi:unnamed protein product, partial [Rotaria sordida]
MANGSFYQRIIYSNGGFRSTSIAIGDFNNDMRLDIVVTNPRNNNIALLFGYANEAFVKERTLSTGNGSRPQSFAIGDFNNDDHMDIAVVNSRTNNVGIFLGYGNNSFTNQLAYTTGAAPKSVALGDFNNDSNLDIVVANSKDDNI